MTIMEAISKEVESVMDYIIMLTDYSKAPADFVSQRGDRKFVLMVRELNPDGTVMGAKAPEPVQEEVEESVAEGPIFE